MIRFEKKVVLITGAVGGLGSAQAQVFAAQGASVAINYVNIGDLAEDAKALSKELSDRYDGQHNTYNADITKENEVIAMVNQIIADYGQIDVLVNNAGISINSTTWKYSADAWAKVLDVNLTGAFYCTKAVLPYMIERKYGRIISISSVVGITGAIGTVAYGSTKAGLIGMTKTIAREVAKKGITVNCVAPGYIDTGIMRDVPEDFKNSNVMPIIPMGHLGEAIDIANAIAFLGSDEAKYITGEVLRVDGGFAM